MSTSRVPGAPKAACTLADFELIRRLGDGSYAQVVLARPKAGGQEVALKIMDKRYLIRHSMVEYIRRERAIMDQLSHPGIVKLFFTFQDAYSLYMGIELCSNGELYDQIRIKRALPESTAQVYAAEIVDVLTYLRARGVVHRDLKPENLLLTAKGHLKLIDFGSAKALPGSAVAAANPLLDPAQASQDPAAGITTEGGGAGWAGAATPAPGTAALTRLSLSGRRSSDGVGLPSPVPSEGRLCSLVGTADYVSPEVLSNEALTPAADLWSLGCVLYQMLVGRPPFKAASEYLTFQHVISATYTVPDHISPQATDLLHALLQRDPAQRLGASSMEDLQGHPFFEGVDWETLWTGQGPSFAEPDLESLGSVSSSFDWELQSLSSALPPGTSYSDVPRVHGSESEIAGSDQD